MQEIKKPSIVLASILKPVDDTRMFEKMGKSLAITNKWNVHIIGSGKVYQDDNINFHPLGVFSRVSWSRINAPLRIFRLFLAIKPHALIITTHELLFISVLYSFVKKVRIIYDVQENYYLNILHTNAFPKALRLPVAFWVRIKEYLSRHFIDHYFLAESCYSNELGFTSGKNTVIENKCILPSTFKPKPDSNKIQFIFTGTIDSTTGIWEAVNLIKQLNGIEKSVELLIIGYCAIADIRKQLQEEIKNNSFIKSIGIDHLVPHHQILEAISRANAGIAFYPSSPHNQNRIPTKVYEYLACQLPIIYDKNASWKSLVQNSNSIVVDFKNPDCHDILNKIKASNISSTAPPTLALWESEAPKFLQIINI